MSRVPLHRGSGIEGPLLETVKLNGLTQAITDRVHLGCPAGMCYYFEDFLGRMAALPDELNARTVFTAGTPSINLVQDTGNGEIQCLLDSTSEAQYAGIDWNDQRTIPANKYPVFTCLANVSTIAANQRVVLGLCSDFNSTLDSTTINAWFRIDGSMVVNLEADDDTTNTDDYATSWTLTASTYYLFAIDLGATPGRATFYIGQPGSSNNATLNYLGDLPFGSAPSTALQPIIGVQKTTGAGVPNVTVDYLRAWWARF